jgi:UDP-GlcNAc:undecaprenyl-phosphate GlcNAc-1-phosphate transferase
MIMVASNVFLKGFLLAALLGCGLTFILARWSVRLRLVAESRIDRWHKKPTPNTGGVAIMLACAASYLAFGFEHYRVVALGSALIGLLGFVDDRVQLRPLMKLAGQAVVVVILIASGVNFRITSWDWANDALTFLWIIGITNAFNLIDNMDGLCAGVAVVICLSRFGLALQNHDAGGMVVLATLAGALLGFLVFNYNPARIFLGDCGSMFLGFSLAALSVASPVPNARVFASTFFCPALTFLYPIFDTALVSILRRAAGRPISVGGRDHSSHRLASLGLSERKVVGLLWLLSSAGAGAGLLTYAVPVGMVAIGTLLLIGVAMFGTFLGTLPAYAPPLRAPVHSPWIRKHIPNLRAGVTLILDVLLAGIALLAAFLVRGDDIFLGEPSQQFLSALPIFMVCHALGAIGLRTFDSGWRWFGLRDLFALGRCALLSACGSMMVQWLLNRRDCSLSVILRYGILILAFTAGLRLMMRILWQTLGKPIGARRAAVLGAIGASELIVLALQRSQAIDAVPVAIIDPDPAANRLRVHGVPVHYVGENLIPLLRSVRADLLVVSACEDVSEGHRRALEQCRAAGITVLQFEIGVRTWTADSHNVNRDSQVVHNRV